VTIHPGQSNVEALCEVAHFVDSGFQSFHEQVLHLAAAGLADAEIASRLHLSPRTVGNHLSSVYRKLGVASRTAAIREARELSLL